MLIKLIKHEFRATGRIALPLCGIMLALSLVASVVLRYWDAMTRSGGFGEMAGSIIVALYSMSIFAVAVGIFIILMQHFKRNLLGDEGYLMRTLPVSEHELLLSKLFVALIWYMASAVLIALSLLLVGALAGELASADLSRLLDILRSVLAEDPGLPARAILGGLGGMSLLTLLFYADFTMTQSFSKHKVLYNIACAVIMLVLLRLVFGLNELFTVRILHSRAMYTAGNSLGVIGGADGPTAVYVTSSHSFWLVELYAFDVLLYFLTWFFLRRKPSLE